MNTPPESAVSALVALLQGGRGSLDLAASEVRQRRAVGGWARPGAGATGVAQVPNEKRLHWVAAAAAPHAQPTSLPPPTA